MKISYKKLWVQLIEKDITKKQFHLLGLRGIICFW
jgi:hypothetical protein